MNFDYWQGELSIYEDDVVDKDYGEIATFWRSAPGNIVFKLGDDYKLVEEDDGYGNKFHVIQKKSS